MIPPRFDQAQFWHAARILLACVIAYGVSWALGLPEGYWSLITVFVVTQPQLETTLTASRDRIFGTLLGAAMGAVAILGEIHGLPILPLYTVCLIPLVLLTAMWAPLRLSCITLTIVFLTPSGDPTFLVPVWRVVEILIGTLAALLVAIATPAPSEPVGMPHA